MKLSLLLKTIDQWSKPARDAIKATGGLTRATDGLKKSTGHLDRAVSRARTGLVAFWRDSERGERIGRRLGAAIRFGAGNAFHNLRWGIAAASNELGKFSRKALLWSAGKLGSAIGWGIGGVVAGGVAATGILGRGVISNSAQFEQYQVALEGTEGSAEKARKAMEWVKTFAKDTPYEIDEVTDAFVRARGVGIDPLTGAFRILGDAAGATRKSLMDAIEMMADAQTGEFERLKEFNVTTSVKGQLVTFSYLDKAGKNASKTVKKNMTEIRKAILGVFDAKYAGGMERQSRTLIGIWNNLKDQVTNFELAIGEKGIFNRVKSSLQNALDWVNDPKNGKQIDAWAQRLSDWLTVIWDKSERFIHETNWGEVAKGIGTIVSALVSVVSWVGRAASAWSNWQANMERSSLNRVVNSSGDWFGPSEAEKQAARRRLGELDREQFGQEQARQRPRGGLHETIPGVDWPMGVFKPGDGKPGWPKAPAAQPGQAKISLHVTTDRGVEVRPTGISAKGVGVEVNTGRIMAGAA